MSARVPAHDGRRTSRTRAACSGAAGAAGLTGALVCGSSMVLAGLGVGTSTTAIGMAGMAGMDRASTAPHGLLGLLIRVGPGLLIASAVLIALAFALRRPGAAVPALLAGAVLYAGMYAQPSRAVMYASIAVGYAGWAVLYLWVRNFAAVATVREHEFRSHRGAKEVHDGNNPGPGA